MALTGEPVGSLQETTLIIVAAGRGIGGVGDYAQDLIDKVRPRFHEVIEIRDDRGGRGSRLRDVIRGVRSMRRTERSLGGAHSMSHFELSAGALLPFWAAAFSRAAVKTATVHDPPRLVWWPARTGLLRRLRAVNAATHRPFDRLWRRIEAAVLRRLDIVVLSHAGAAAVTGWAAPRSITMIPHYIRNATPGEALGSRPLAVGLFGYLTPTKGYDRIAELRGLIPETITIRIAGRRTEALPATDGVEVLGPVEGEDEGRFFGSVRAILLPYASSGGFVSASGAAMRALSHGVPVVAPASGVFTEYAARGGILAVPGGLDDLADTVSRLVTDDAALQKASEGVSHAVSHAQISVVADQYREFWMRALTASARSGKHEER